jgi:hypothetical protein
MNRLLPELDDDVREILRSDRAHRAPPDGAKERAFERLALALPLGITGTGFGAGGRGNSGSGGSAHTGGSGAGTSGALANGSSGGGLLTGWFTAQIMKDYTDADCASAGTTEAPTLRCFAPTAWSSLHR